MDEAVAALEAAHARGYNRLDQVLGDPNYRNISDDAGFKALIERWAEEWLVLMESRAAPAQVELRVIAQAQIVLGDLKAAEAAILRAIELGGAKDAEVAEDLVQIRRHLRLEELRERGRSRRGE